MVITVIIRACVVQTWLNKKLKKKWNKEFKEVICLGNGIRLGLALAGLQGTLQLENKSDTWPTCDQILCFAMLCLLTSLDSCSKRSTCYPKNPKRKRFWVVHIGSTLVEHIIGACTCFKSRQRQGAQSSKFQDVPSLLILLVALQSNHGNCLHFKSFLEICFHGKAKVPHHGTAFEDGLHAQSAVKRSANNSESTFSVFQQALNWFYKATWQQPTYQLRVSPSHSLSHKFSINQTLAPAYPTCSSSGYLRRASITPITHSSNGCRAS